ncbi:Autophagy protein 22 [Cryptotrichosporon argae]
MLARISPETRAWYWYAAAAEVYSACALAIFIPILLEQMARDIGVRPDGTSCAGTGKDVACRARVLGRWVDTASFAMYVKSTAVFLQAVVIISVGTLADSPFWRKRLLVGLVYAGACTALVFPLLPASTSSAVPLAAAALAVLSSIAHATAGVCSNAFLPALARADPAVRAAAGLDADADVVGDGDVGGDVDVDRDGTADGDATPLRPSVDEARRLLPTTPAIVISSADLAATDPGAPSSEADADDAAATPARALATAMSRLSATQTAVGFSTGLAVLSALLVPVSLGHGSTRTLQRVTGAAAAWWALAALPAALGLPGGERAKAPDRWARQAWVKVGSMVRADERRRLPNLFMYLLAWVFLSDGFHTTTSTAILYASSTLRMSAPKIVALGLLVQLCAVASSALAPRLQARLGAGASNMRVLVGAVALAQALPVYTCAGLVLPVGGLRTEAEMYVATAWFGILYGPFNSYSRAVYAELIPPGHESSFFSLFALTDKSASFIGPAVVGAIADATGNIRYGFLFLLVLLAAPVPILLRVDPRRGAAEARAWVAPRRAA